MRTSIVVLGVAALAAAQTNTTSCCSVNAGTVDPNQRLSWCRAQRNTCPELCTNGQTSANDCNQETLTFTCTCLSGSTPNISDYAQTLPSLECDEWKRQCIADHPNDLAGQNFCLSFVCGTRNATQEGAGAGSSTGGSSSSGSSSASSGSGTTPTGSSSSPTTSPNAATLLKAGSQYGTAGVLMGLLGLFAYAL